MGSRLLQPSKKHLSAGQPQSRQNITKCCHCKRNEVVGKDGEPSAGGIISLSIDDTNGSGLFTSGSGLPSVAILTFASDATLRTWRLLRRFRSIAMTEGNLDFAVTLRLSAFTDFFLNLLRYDEQIKLLMRR